MPSRAAYRRWTLQELQGRDLTGFTANASGGTTTTLVDDDMKSSASQNMLWRDYWLHLPGAAQASDRSRMVQSFSASTGIFTVEKAWSGASVSNSAPYELNGFIEPETDLHLLINEALKRILLPVEFNFAPAPKNDWQDLTAEQPWLTNPMWVRDVRVLGRGGEQLQTITETGSPTGGTFTLSYRGATTGGIAFNASAAAVQTALRALHGDLASVTVERTGTSNFVWTVTMVGAPLAYQPACSADASQLTGGSSPGITTAIARSAGVARRLGGRAVQESQRVYAACEHRFEEGERLYVSALKPAYFHCRATSSQAFGTQSGLSGEAHEAVPPVELVGFGALAIAARRSQNTLTEAMRDAIATNERRWAAMFERHLQQYFNVEQDAPRCFRPTLRFGPGDANTYPHHW